MCTNSSILVHDRQDEESSINSLRSDCIILKSQNVNNSFTINISHVYRIFVWRFAESLSGDPEKKSKFHLVTDRTMFSDNENLQYPNFYCLSEKKDKTQTH